MDDTTKQADEKMQKAIDVMQNEFKTVRTGRANPSIVENIKAEYYGTPTPLKQLAVITVPDPRTIFIKPYDLQVLQAIEKSILASDVGLTPQNDGKVIRLPIPPLSEDRRKQIAQYVETIVEKAKVAVRNIRRDLNKTIDDKEKEKKISQDVKFRAKDEIQKLTERYEKKIDELSQKKIKEVMEV